MDSIDLPKKGDIIAGKLQVEDVLGRGGMGVVVAARHVALGRRVAVKFLLPEALRVPDARERFLREARAAVAIQSEHVARVLDVGSLDDGAPYMVMEFLAGTDLGKRIKRGGPLAVDDAIDFVLQAGEAIAEAHALGIVHRDLKPSNLFLTARPEGTPLVKVLDFGLSKMSLPDQGAPEASLTATDFIMGSPQYMSPEQLRSLKSVDQRTDIWALGVILYEMLAGKRPFEGPSITAVTTSIVLDTPEPLHRMRGDVAPGLDAVIAGCLTKDRDRRTRSVADLALALAPFAPARARAAIDRIVRLAAGAAPAPAAPPYEAGTLTLPMNTPPPAPAFHPPPIAAPPPPPVAQAPAPTFRPSLPPPVPASPPIAAPPPRASLPSFSSSRTSVPAQTGVEMPTAGSAWGQTRPVPGRSQVTWIVAASAGMLLAAAALLAVWALHRSTRIEPTAATASPPPAEATITAPSTSTAAPPAASTIETAPPAPTVVPAETAAPAPPKPSATAAPKPSAKPDPPKAPRKIRSVLDNPD